MTTTTTTTITITITAAQFAAALAGDWDDVSAEALAEILEAITERGDDPAQYAGLSDRVDSGPTLWEAGDELGSSEMLPAEMDLCEAKEAWDEWTRGGEWGQDGAVVSGWIIPAGWRGHDTHVSCEIEPDHEALINAAGGDTDCDHDWTAEGEGGLDENPGVWSTGGTSMTFATHCRVCGLHRVEHSTGSQRNPGEHDTVEYEQPATWCAGCEREECRHHVQETVVEYTDCDDDEPRGVEHGDGYDTEAEAREAGLAVAHERNVRSPDTVVIAHDDTEDGDDLYHAYIVS